MQEGQEQLRDTVLQIPLSQPIASLRIACVDVSCLISEQRSGEKALGPLRTDRGEKKALSSSSR